MKELDKEVVKKLHLGEIEYSESGAAITEQADDFKEYGAKIAAEHYEPKIQELEKELERVTELLKGEYFHNKRYVIALESIHVKKPLETIRREHWQQFCTENNIK